MDFLYDLGILGELQDFTGYACHSEALLFPGIAQLSVAFFFKVETNIYLSQYILLNGGTGVASNLIFLKASPSFLIFVSDKS